jgi:hypothetical protein
VPHKEEIFVATPPIPVKTPDGQAELASRRRRVSQRHRTVLFLIDGKRTEDQVRTLARQAGSSDSCFDELLTLGMIELPAASLNGVAAESTLHVDIPIEAGSLGAGPIDIGSAAAAEARAPEAHDDAEESLLPAARTLQPESVLTDSMLGDSMLSDSIAAADSELPDGVVRSGDASMEEARGILLRAVRAEAPLAGSLTILRLRRARSRSELADLIDEVEARIIKPYRSLAAQQTLRRARQLLLSNSFQASPGN